MGYVLQAGEHVKEWRREGSERGRKEDRGKERERGRSRRRGKKIEEEMEEGGDGGRGSRRIIIWFCMLEIRGIP